MTLKEAFDAGYTKVKYSTGWDNGEYAFLSEDKTKFIFVNRVSEIGDYITWSVSDNRDKHWIGLEKSFFHCMCP